MPETARDDEQPPIGDPVEQYALVTGLRAIQPQTSAPGEPAFTTADVVEYLATNSLSYVDLSKGPPTIVSIEFLTTQQVAERIGATAHRPPEYLVCLVTLSGTFTVRGPEGGYTSSVGYQLFDAQTGNLLMEGVGE